MVNVKRKLKNYKHKLRDRTVLKNNFIRDDIFFQINLMAKRNNNFQNFFFMVYGESNNQCDK